MQALSTASPSESHLIQRPNWRDMNEPRLDPMSRSFRPVSVDLLIPKGRAMASPHGCEECPDIVDPRVSGRENRRKRSNALVTKVSACTLGREERLPLDSLLIGGAIERFHPFLGVRPFFDEFAKVI